MAKLHIDKLGEVTIVADSNFETSCNSVLATYFEHGVPYRTNSLNLAFDKVSREKVVELLQSAIEQLTNSIRYERED